VEAGTATEFAISYRYMMFEGSYNPDAIVKLNIPLPMDLALGLLSLGVRVRILPEVPNNTQKDIHTWMIKTVPQQGSGVIMLL
jgi:hypothetical protein